MNDLYTYYVIMTADYNRTDVSLEQICTWTSYCTNHSDMDNPQYAKVL